MLGIDSLSCFGSGSIGHFVLLMKLSRILQAGLDTLSFHFETSVVSRPYIGGTCNVVLLLGKLRGWGGDTNLSVFSSQKTINSPFSLLSGVTPCN